jgi:hypothetical protein
MLDSHRYSHRHPYEFDWPSLRIAEQALKMDDDKGPEAARGNEEREDLMDSQDIADDDDEDMDLATAVELSLCDTQQSSSYSASGPYSLSGPVAHWLQGVPLLDGSAEDNGNVNKPDNSSMENKPGSAPADLNQPSTGQESIPLPKVAKKAKVRKGSWYQTVYSPWAGTTVTGAYLIKILHQKGLTSPTSTAELAKYSNYEFEHFSYLQEIVPNLFLGR